MWSASSRLPNTQSASTGSTARRSTSKNDRRGPPRRRRRSGCWWASSTPRPTPPSRSPARSAMSRPPAVRRPRSRSGANAAPRSRGSRASAGSRQDAVATFTSKSSASWRTPRTRRRVSGRPRGTPPRPGHVALHAGRSATDQISPMIVIASAAPRRRRAPAPRATRQAQACSRRTRSAPSRAGTGRFRSMMMGLRPTRPRAWSRSAP